MTWRVTVDTGLCISSGMCLGIAPGRFHFDESQHSTPVSTPTEPDEQIRDAAASCPVEAILLTDADTGTLVPLNA
ncbi:ferredoxin [Streptomyces collinus]|uniref:ferredoxin n=1 Tax=Streptomyces collinus TaxID=42684 RepID=UPI0036AA0E4C